MSSLVRKFIGNTQSIDPISIDSISPIESIEQFIPGDVKINSITISSEDFSRAMDIAGYAKIINIYESILSPVIFCEIEMSDSINLLQTFPIVGEEIVYLEIETIDRLISKYTFRINSIKNRTVSDNHMNYTYTLELMSEDLLKNSNVLISKRIEDNISNSISAILYEDLGTNLHINVENTIGVENLTITRMNPFVAIDHLRTRAVSSKHSSSSFVFYRDRNSYNFVTIEKLFSEGAKNIEFNDKHFFFDNLSQNTSKENNTFRNIISYQQVGFADTISKISSGSFSSIVNRYDILTGKTTTFVTDKNRKPVLSDINGKSSTSSYFKNKNSSFTPKISTIPTTSSNPENQIPEKQTNLSDYISNMTENITQIYVYGDTSLNIGEVISCTFVEATGMTESKNISKDSGNYLVSKMRHIIINSDRPQHMMSMELLKGGFIDN